MNIEQTINENTITLKAINEDCIGSSFLLHCKLKESEEVLGEIEITVTGLF